MTEKSPRMGLSAIAALVGIAGVAFPGAVYLVQIGPALSNQGDRLAKIETRVDRIEEARAVGLQRLSKVEETSVTTTRALERIDLKLDRLLFERGK